jgi:hypothetical protein
MRALLSAIPERTRRAYASNADQAARFARLKEADRRERAEKRRRENLAPEPMPELPDPTDPNVADACAFCAQLRNRRVLVDGDLAGVCSAQACPAAGPAARQSVDAIAARTENGALKFARGMFVRLQMELHTGENHIESEVKRSPFGTKTFAAQRVAIRASASQMSKSELDEARSIVDDAEKVAGAVFYDVLRTNKLDGVELLTPLAWFGAMRRLVRVYAESEAKLVRVLHAAMTRERECGQPVKGECEPPCARVEKRLLGFLPYSAKCAHTPRADAAERRRNVGGIWSAEACGLMGITSRTL